MTKLQQNPGKLSHIHFFKKYGGLNFLLQCNYDLKFLEKSGIPVFYRKILANFLEIRNLYKHNNGQDLNLFNNKDILIDGNSFFVQNVEKRASSQFKTSWTMMESSYDLNHFRTNLRSNAI